MPIISMPINQNSAEEIKNFMLSEKRFRRRNEGTRIGKDNGFVGILIKWIFFYKNC